MCGCVDMCIGVCGAMYMSLYKKIKINNTTEINIYDTGAARSKSKGGVLRFINA